MNGQWFGTSYVGQWWGGTPVPVTKPGGGSARRRRQIEQNELILQLVMQVVLEELLE